MLLPARFASVFTLQSSPARTARQGARPGMLLAFLGALFTGVLSGSPAWAQAVYQINCGGGAVSPFAADADFSSPSSTFSVTNNISIPLKLSNPAPMACYQSERTSTNPTVLTYTFTGLTPSTLYTVRLHFAELVYTAAGQRTFNVSLNGGRWLTAFDVFAAAGNAQFTAVDESKNVPASGQGKIAVALTPVVGNPAVNAIEVLANPYGVLTYDVPQPGWIEDTIVPLDGSFGDESGPSAANAVNLASGVYDNRPGPDVVVHNPYGPAPIFERRYRTINAYRNVASAGLPPGWTHNYDLKITGTSGAWSNLTFIYPNGAAEIWAPLFSGGVPTGQFILPPGTPYLVTGVPSGTVGKWTSLTITFKDESQWSFKLGSGTGAPYVLTKIQSLTGSYLTLIYDSSNRLTTIKDDGSKHGASDQIRLMLTYSNGNDLSELEEYSDLNNPRRIDYTTTTVNGIVCLASASMLYLASGSAPSPPRWQYTYNTLVAGVPFLDSVTVPLPNGQAGTSTSTIQYDDVQGVAYRQLDANGNYHLDGIGNVLIQDPGGLPGTGLSWTQSLGPSNRNDGDVDANGAFYNVEYSDMGNNPLRPTTFINRNNQTSMVKYDTVGNLYEIDTPCDGTGPPDSGRILVTTLGYDTSQFPLGRLNSVAVAGKTPTTLTYYTSTGNGGIAGLVQYLKTPQPGTAYPAGMPVTTTYTYTSLGNMASVAVPSPDTISGRQVTYTFNYTTDGTFSQPEALGEPLTVTDPLGHVTHYRWDARGNLSSVTDAMGNMTSFVYDVDDDLMQITYPLITQPANQGNQPSMLVYSYAYLGGPLLTATLYNQSGTVVRTTSATPGLEGETLNQQGNQEQGSATYDALYRFESLLGGLGNGTQHLFDRVGNLQYLQYPNVNTGTHFDETQGQFDADHNLTAFIDGLNRTTTLNVDSGMLGDGRLDSVAFPASTLPQWNYTYDAFDRPATIAETGGAANNTYEYVYDDLDAITTATTTYAAMPSGVNTFPVQYAYNNDGSRASMELQVPGGSNYTFDYFYDDAGRLTSVQMPWQNLANNAPEFLTYTYQNNDWLMSQSNSLYQTSYTYNQRGFLLSQVTNATDLHSTLLSQYDSAQYDASGNLLAMNVTVPFQTSSGSSAPALAVSGATISYTYQGEDTLTGENSQRNGTYNARYNYTYAADAEDNLTNFNGLMFTPNADDQIGSDSLGNTYLYDGDGNRYQTPWADHDVNGNPTLTNLTLSYDVLDRMTQFGGYLTAGYRPDGLRAFKKTTTGGAYTYFLYDGTHLLAEFDANGHFLDLYGWGANGLVERDTSNTLFYAYSFDPLGNLVQRHSVSGRGVPNALIDFTAGYDAFGAQVGAFSVYSNEEATGQDCVGFAGQWGGYTDQETATYGKLTAGLCISRMPLVLMGYRYYDPQTARFLTRDPQGTEGGIDLYAYCRNNPILNWDPLGLDDEDYGGTFLGQLFNPDTWKQGLTTSGAVLGDTFSGGLYSSRAHKNDPGYEAAAWSAWIGREALVTAASLGLGKIAETAKAAWAARAATAARTPCFVAGTRVAMADGSSKSIEQIKVGERVMSRDPKTGVTAAKRVTRTFEHVANETLVLSLSSGEQIEATPGHPFFVEGVGFTSAGKLALGNAIVTRAGPSVSVTGIGHKSGSVNVYNLEVEEFHTYFVGTANGGAWVHNDCSGWFRDIGFAGFRGIAQNAPLRELTDTEVRKCLTDAGLNPTNHFIMRMRDVRTEALGMRTLNDFRQMLRYGRLSAGDEAGIGYLEHGQFRMVFDTATRKLISLVPR